MKLIEKQFDESTGPDSYDSMDAIEDALERAKLPASKRTRTFNAMSLVHDSFKPMQWAVKDFLPEGCVLFAGRPKLGKSWLAYQVAIAVASGGKALGEIPVKEGEVLYLALEDGRQRLQWRLQTLLKSSDQMPSRLHLAMEWPPLDEGGLEELELWLQRYASTARLIIIDTFQRIRPAGSGDSVYSIDFNSLRELTDLTREFPVCIMVVHHTRKAGAEDAFDTMSGSTGLTGAVDALLVLKRSRGRADAEMHITGRDVEETAKALRFDKETMVWQLLGEAHEVWQSADRAAIRTLLKGAEKGMRAGEIAAYLGKREMSVRQTLSRMLRDGQVSLLDRGLYGVQK